MSYHDDWQTIIHSHDDVVFNTFASSLGNKNILFDVFSNLTFGGSLKCSSVYLKLI